MQPEKLMQIAIDAARRGIAAGQTPFGCAIAIEDKIVAACHNTVWLTTDVTAHAEINAIREACRRTSQVLLTGCVVATTCEPCPMCMAALHWARATTVFYGATIADATQAGFNELSVPAESLLQQGGSSVQLINNVQSDACRDLFQQWQQQKDAQAY
ncbi:MAG: nucleoside deaminase [Planctomycetales bacterium]|nr:nucleoside deaminase [Planctomycetales bacterium]